MIRSTDFFNKVGSGNTDGDVLDALRSLSEYSVTELIKLLSDELHEGRETKTVFSCLLEHGARAQTFYPTFINAIFQVFSELDNDDIVSIDPTKCSDVLQRLIQNVPKDTALDALLRAEPFIHATERLRLMVDDRILVELASTMPLDSGGLPIVRALANAFDRPMLAAGVLEEAKATEDWVDNSEGAADAVSEKLSVSKQVEQVIQRKKDLADFPQLLHGGRLDDLMEILGRYKDDGPTLLQMCRIKGSSGTIFNSLLKEKRLDDWKAIVEWLAKSGTGFSNVQAVIASSCIRLPGVVWSPVALAVIDRWWAGLFPQQFNWLRIKYSNAKCMPDSKLAIIQREVLATHLDGTWLCSNYLRGGYWQKYNTAWKRDCERWIKIPDRVIPAIEHLAKNPYVQPRHLNQLWSLRFPSRAISWKFIEQTTLLYKLISRGKSPLVFDPKLWKGLNARQIEAIITPRHIQAFVEKYRRFVTYGKDNSRSYDSRLQSGCSVFANILQCLRQAGVSTGHIRALMKEGMQDVSSSCDKRLVLTWMHNMPEDPAWLYGRWNGPRVLKADSVEYSLHDSMYVIADLMKEEASKEKSQQLARKWLLAQPGAAGSRLLQLLTMADPKKHSPHLEAWKLRLSELSPDGEWPSLRAEVLTEFLFANPEIPAGLLGLSVEESKAVLEVFGFDLKIPGIAVEEGAEAPEETELSDDLLTVVLKIAADTTEERLKENLKWGMLVAAARMAMSGYPSVMLDHDALATLAHEGVATPEYRLACQLLMALGQAVPEVDVKDGLTGAARWLYQGVFGGGAAEEGELAQELAKKKAALQLDPVSEGEEEAEPSAPPFSLLDHLDESTGPSPKPSAPVPE